MTEATATSAEATGGSVGYYSLTSSPQGFLQEAVKAFLRCLGLEKETAVVSQEVESSSTGSEKESEAKEPEVGGGDASVPSDPPPSSEAADDPPSSTEAGADPPSTAQDDPPATTTTLLRAAPTRPPINTGRGGQGN